MTEQRSNILSDSPELKKAIEWIERIRSSEWQTPNEKNMLLLLDEIYRLRKLLKAKR